VDGVARDAVEEYLLGLGGVVGGHVEPDHAVGLGFAFGLGSVVGVDERRVGVGGMDRDPEHATLAVLDEPRLLVATRSQRLGVEDTARGGHLRDLARLEPQDATSALGEEQVAGRREREVPRNLEVLDEHLRLHVGRERRVTGALPVGVVARPRRLVVGQVELVLRRRPAGSGAGRLLRDPSAPGEGGCPHRGEKRSPGRRRKFAHTPG
jgi:hypothetical protein